MLNLDLKSPRTVFTAIFAAVISFLIVFAVGSVMAVNDGPDESEKPPSSTDEERQDRFQPGQEWDGEGTQGISQRDAEEFSDYPLVWLGESFAGYNLQAIVRQNYDPPDGIPEYEAMDSVTFGYGECVILDNGRACPVPVVVAVEPACLKRPDNITDAMKAGSLETFGDGAELLRFRDGHLRVWAGEVSIYIDAPADQKLTEQMLHELRGMNTSTWTGGSLPAPDFSDCPEMELPTVDVP